MAGRARPYRFGPRDRQGLILGVRSSQAVLIATTLVLAVGELRAVHTPLRLPFAVLELVAGLAAAFLPVRGRTLEEWAPVVVRYSSGIVSGSHRSVTLPAKGARRTPAPFSGFSLLSLSNSGSGEIGALLDRRRGTLTGVLSLGGESFALLDDEERDRRVAAWSSVLAAVGNGAEPPFRVQWLQRTVPDRRSAIRQRADASSHSEGESTAIDAARRSYAGLVAAEASTALRHETLLAVSIQQGGSTRLHRRSVVGSDSKEASAERLVRALSTLRRRGLDAGLVVDGVLSCEGLSRVVRRSFERGEPTAVSHPWPLACEETWSALRTDGTWHTTFWIAEWPRAEVGSDFLLPLLLEGGERRTLSMVMAPVAAHQAVQRAERARTTATADGELRRRHGFSRTAQATTQHESVARREEELAAGHVGYRFSGYLVVTADSEADLERSSARVEQAAAISRLELRRLFGAQGDAFVFGLPLGRGCS